VSFNMRLILIDRAAARPNFYPLALSRPIWDLRCGITTLGEKLVDTAATTAVACWLPPYMAEVWRNQTAWPVNDPHSLAGDDLLLVDARVKPAGLTPFVDGPSRVALDSAGEVLIARIAHHDLARLPADSIETLLRSACQTLPAVPGEIPVWNYTWELVLANPQQLTEDFHAIGHSGIDGNVEEPSAVRGSRNELFIGRGSVVHPMVVLDAEHGPIYIDEDAEIHPFTRIEGPCYIGRKSILLGAKCREGNSIGPMCRIGGEVEESIIQGYSNKYHDGFLGHAYVGEWVNLGALTTNSDLKNDYSEVKIALDGRKQIHTGSTKVGALIGDHAKTSIGTLLNTGACVGAMTLLVTSGRLMPKFIPSFTWYLHDAITAGSGRESLYVTTRAAMARRQCQWTAADAAMWNAIYEITAEERESAIHDYRLKAAGGSR
jgi:UDP-N-acetylglucosamine diphosphorylase / glucose-1-phosphate thymidylyltransferase / UDP-N-acetylgalactosamine diphosphorylase / glucosamine-1-phosphate N-acetyltransferase / galactosamine-1-phosphate N-acetyltransferase